MWRALPRGLEGNCCTAPFIFRSFRGASDLYQTSGGPLHEQGRGKDQCRESSGKRAVVIQTVNNLAQTGQVRINDIEWTARTVDDGEEIPTGAVVEIEEIRGVKLIVKELSKEG